MIRCCSFGGCTAPATREVRRYSAGFAEVVDVRDACQEHAWWLARLDPTNRTNVVARPETILPPAPTEAVTACAIPGPVRAREDIETMGRPTVRPGRMAS